ncbi:PRD domain-containing protein [Enterococcus mundtii]|nr:PRD domain-containing protein [Enterococcus mundtii]
MERFIDQNIEVILDQLLLESELDETEDVLLNEETAKSTCVSFIADNFTFINGEKLIDPLWKFADGLMDSASIDVKEYGFMINLVLHAAGMIERVILNEPLSLENQDNRSIKNDPLYVKIVEPLNDLEEKIKVKFPLEEVYYLLKMITNHLEKKEYTNEDIHKNDTLK